MLKIIDCCSSWETDLIFGNDRKKIRIEKKKQEKKEIFKVKL